MGKWDDIEVWEAAPKPKKAGGRDGGPGRYVMPWAATAAMIPVGWLAHLAWGDAGASTGLAAAGITAVGGAVTWVAHRLCRARTWYAAVMAPAVTGGATAWMAVATVAGVGRPWVDLLILGGGLLAVMNVAGQFRRPICRGGHRAQRQGGAQGGDEAEPGSGGASMTSTGDQ